MADLTPEALAAELEAEADAPSDSPHSAWRSMLLRDFAQLVRERLAPAHAALTAERDAARAENARYRGALEDIEARGLGDGTDARTARQALEGGR
jgi:hypothetical protein